MPLACTRAWWPLNRAAARSTALSSAWESCPALPCSDAARPDRMSPRHRRPAVRPTAYAPRRCRLGGVSGSA